MTFDHPSIRRLVRLALEEDIGRGDATTAATVSAGIPGRATIIARHPVVVAGLPILRVVFAEAVGGVCGEGGEGWDVADLDE